MNINNFKVEKKGVNFEFRNPELSKYGELTFEYKVIGIKENKRNDGFFLNAKFDPKVKAIRCEFKMDGKKISGMGLEEEMFETINNYYINAVEERENKINNIVKEIIDGNVPISFDIVGCDFPHYQAWINEEYLEGLKGQEQNIMEKAIKEYTCGVEYISTACDYLNKRLKVVVGTVEELPNNIFNIGLNKKVQEYHNFKDTIVTKFDIKLSDLIDINMIKNKIEVKRKEEEYKNSLDMEIIKKGKYNGDEGDDLYANVKLTNPKTGETLKFSCRNIFDFGYVINPEYSVIDGKESGGIVNEGHWEIFDDEKGWYKVRELTEFEKYCVNYLKDFPPVYKGIRI